MKRNFFLMSEKTVFLKLFENSKYCIDIWLVEIFTINLNNIQIDYNKRFREKFVDIFLKTS